MKNFKGVFENDFNGFELSKTGKTIKVVDNFGIWETYRVKDAGTADAYFEAKGQDGSVVKYFLKDFTK